MLSPAAPRPALEAPGWAVKLCQDITQWIEAKLRGPFICTIYTIATLPDATKHRGGWIAVSDETGGFTWAGSDGTNWRRMQDRAIVS